MGFEIEIHGYMGPKQVIQPSLSVVVRRHVRGKSCYLPILPSFSILITFGLIQTKMDQLKLCTKFSPFSSSMQLLTKSSPFYPMKKRPKQPLQLKAATKDRGAPPVWRHDKHLINLSYSTVEKLELGKSPHKYGFMWCKHRFFLSNIFQDLMTMYSEINLYGKRGKTGGIYSIRLYIFLWQQLTARLRSLLRVLIEPTRIDPMVYQREKKRRIHESKGHYITKLINNALVGNP